jgi:lipopolysaccharide transport system ATP-binding protein
MSSDAIQMGCTVTDDVVIDVRNVAKSYQIYDRPSHRLLQGLFGGSRKFYREFWALRDVDLTVRRGETLGIIGRNGSGKSTMLQLVAGTLAPTRGEVNVRGRIAALLELGSGFNPEFTGRENVYLNASILGLNRAEIDQRLDSMLAFADIGDFIDQPVRSYSSGMVMRLAFSVMTHVDAEVLIIDEALSVGDAFFTQKCMRFLREFQQRGTLLFVSHDAGAVTGLCDRAIWLDKGVVRMEGASRDVANAYLEAFVAEREGRQTGSATPPDAQTTIGKTRRDVRGELFERTHLRNDIHVLEFRHETSGFGDGTGRIVDVALLDMDGRQLHSIMGGETVVLEVVAESFCKTAGSIVGFYFKDRLGQLLFGDNTHLTTLNAPINVDEGRRLVARFQFDMPRLQQGDYFITAGLAHGTQQEHVIQHWLHEALSIKAEGQGIPVGIIGLPMSQITLEASP